MALDSIRQKAAQEVYQPHTQPLFWPEHVPIHLNRASKKPYEQVGYSGSRDFRREDYSSGKETDPLVGDWVDFPDDHTERVSYVWQDSLNTSDGGSFHLCERGDGVFSGPLNGSIKLEHFTDSGMTRPGWFWLYHHNVWHAYNAVHCRAPCRVWNCDCLRD